MVFQHVDWDKYKYIYVVAFSKTGKTRRLQAKVAEWLKPRCVVKRLVLRHVGLPVSAGLFDTEAWLLQQAGLDRAKVEFPGQVAVVLLVPTYLPTRAEKALGVGVVSEPLKKAVKSFAGGLDAGDVFVVGTGNRRFGPDFGLAAKKIAGGLGLPDGNLVLTENDLWPPVG